MPRKVIKLLSFILSFVLIITNIAPINAYAKSLISTGYYSDDDGDAYEIYYYDDGSEEWILDPIISIEEYIEDGRKYTTYTYASGNMSCDFEYIDSEWIESSETEDDENYDDEDAQEEEFGDSEESFDDGYNFDDDSIISIESYIIDDIEYTTIYYASGAIQTSERYLFDDSDSEIIVSNPICEEEVFSDEDNLDYTDYERKIQHLRNIGATDEDDQYDYFWTYDSHLKKLTIAANHSNILNYTTDGNSFPWSKYRDKIELVAVTGIKTIYANAFKNYPKLKKIYTNGDLNYMSTYAFIGCDNLAWIYINSYNCTLDADSWTNLKKMNDKYDKNHISNHFKVSCHYDNNSSSIYSLCNKNQIRCEIIESVSQSNSIISDVKSGFKDLYNQIINLFNNKDVSDDENNQYDENFIDKIYIHQTHPSILNMSDGKVIWGKNACVVCTVAMMIERYAAYQGYHFKEENEISSKKANVFYYSTDNSIVSNDELKLVEELTINETVDYGRSNDNGWSFKYDNDITVNEFKNSDGLPMQLKLYRETSVNDEILQMIIKDHPEGVDAHIYKTCVDADGNKYTDQHSVLVIGYNEQTQKYKILDTGSLNPAPNPRRIGTNGCYEVSYDFLSNRFDTETVYVYYITDSYY